MGSEKNYFDDNREKWNEREIRIDATNKVKREYSYDKNRVAILTFFCWNSYNKSSPRYEVIWWYSSSQCISYDIHVILIPLLTP